MPPRRAALPEVLTRIGAVGLLTLNKPAKLNAWDRPMRDDIVAALRAWHLDDTIGAVVMTGAGDRAFSAGQDFAEAHGFDAERIAVSRARWNAERDPDRYADLLRAAATAVSAPQLPHGRAALQRTTNR